MPIDLSGITDTGKALCAGLTVILFVVLVLMMVSGRNRRR